MSDPRSWPSTQDSEAPDVDQHLLTDRAHRLRAAIPALRFASHPDRMSGPYAMTLAGLADDIEAGRVVYTRGAR